MQTQPVRRLAQQLRSERRILKSWRRAAARLHVLRDDGEPNPGLAYRIAQHHYMPTPEGMDRLMRDHAIPKPKPRPMRIDQMSRQALIRAIENRRPMPRLKARVIRALYKWLEPRRVCE